MHFLMPQITYGIPTFSLICLILSSSAFGQNADEPQEQPKLRTLDGPVDGSLGTIANIKVPEGYSFIDKAQMPLLNKLTGNLDNPRDVGAVLAQQEGWLVFFSWDEIGYVDDSDRDELDAEELLETFKESEGPANKRREQLGMTPLYIAGWKTPPYYDPDTNNLTWALENRIGDGDKRNINHEVRVLGRKGAMSVTLVAGPDELDSAVPKLGTLLTGFSFNDGQRYAEYVPGDKVAEYGLAGLVLGGGALAAAKTGLLAKLGKFIKVIVIGGIAVLAGLWNFIKRMFGGGRSNSEEV